MFAVIPDGTALGVDLIGKPVAFFEFEMDAQIYSAQKYHNHVKIVKCHVKKTFEFDFETQEGK